MLTVRFNFMASSFLNLTTQYNFELTDCLDTNKPLPPASQNFSYDLELGSNFIFLYRGLNFDRHQVPSCFVRSTARQDQSLAYLIINSAFRKLTTYLRVLNSSLQLLNFFLLFPLLFQNMHQCLACLLIPGAFEIFCGAENPCQCVCEN